jgi:hypothetical protein
VDLTSFLRGIYTTTTPCHREQRLLTSFQHYFLSGRSFRLILCCPCRAAAQRPFCTTVSPASSTQTTDTECVDTSSGLPTIPIASHSSCLPPPPAPNGLRLHEHVANGISPFLNRNIRSTFITSSTIVNSSKRIFRRFTNVTFDLDPESAVSAAQPPPGAFDTAGRGQVLGGQEINRSPPESRPENVDKTPP